MRYTVPMRADRFAAVVKPNTTEVYAIDLQKSKAVEDRDGVLTAYGMEVAEDYATAWLRGIRDLELERAHPTLAGFFADIRHDVELARQHARPE